jgi:hypothetical protein
MQELGTSKRDNGRSGDFDQVTDTMVIGQNQTFERYAALGKVLVAAGAVTPDAGNTGDGVLDNLALAAGGPAKVGDYVATCVAAAVDGGTFEVVDPDGQLVGNVEVGASFSGGGISFDLADGATDFIVGDNFALTIAAGSGQGAQLDNTAVDGTEVLVAIAADAVETGVGETQTITVYLTGEFNEDEITFANGTVAEYEAAARNLSIFFQSAVPQ